MQEQPRRRSQRASIVIRVALLVIAIFAIRYFRAGNEDTSGKPSDVPRSASVAPVMPAVTPPPPLPSARSSAGPGTPRSSSHQADASLPLAARAGHEIERCIGPGIVTLEAARARLKPEPGTEHEAWRNLHVELANGPRLRVRLSPRDSADAGTSLQARYYVEDAEGLPAPVKTPKELAGLAPDEQLRSLRSRGRVVFEQASRTFVTRAIGDKARSVTITETGGAVERLEVTTQPRGESDGSPARLICEPDRTVGMTDCLCE